jgi:clan AA aspartic protease (TIGR02281 family)
MAALLAIAGVAGLVPVSCAVAALIGLGVVRDLAAGQVALTAALLTMLPIAGIWAMLGRRNWAVVLGEWVWPAAILLGLPGYFPGEVSGAVATGFAVLAAPAGLDYAKKAAKLGEHIVQPVAAAPEGALPPPEAARAAPECLPSPVPANGDQVAIPYEGQGHSMALPVQFGDVELQMLFDTGASVTTLDTASLRKLGIRVPSDAPTVTLRTANGERTSQLVIVPKVWIGGLEVDGVTVGVCEECADDRTSGLLGLNVSSQFLVTVDTARRELVLQDRGTKPDRVADVAPWLHISALATIYPDTRVEVKVDADNDADRAVRSATVGIHCGKDAFTATLTDVPAGGKGSTVASLPRGTDCATYKVTLDHASW